MTPVRLSRVARTISGVGFPHYAQGSTEGTLPFLKVSDLADSRNQNGVVTAANWITRRVAQELGVRIVPPGAVLFPKVGAALLGNARALTKVPCAIDNNMMAVVPTTGDPRYWLHLLTSVDMGTLSQGGTLPFVSDTAVRDLTLPTPSVEEQRRIADFLDDQTTRIDRLIAGRTQQIDSVTEAAAAFAFAAVTGQGRLDRDPTGIAWATDLPAGWGSPRLNQVARMGTGHTPSRSVPEYWVGCDTPWLTTGDVHKFRRDEIDVLDETEIHISELGLANSAAVLHPRGTVALSRTASAGFSIVMGQDMATSQDFATWTCGPALDNRFLLWCLRAMRRDLLGRLAMGSTHKTIYFPDLASIRVPLPPLAEQRAAVVEISNFVAGSRGAKTEIARSIELLHEYKRSLISAAVSGEFDVTSASGRGVPA